MQTRIQEIERALRIIYNNMEIHAYKQPDFIDHVQIKIDKVVITYDRGFLYQGLNQILQQVDKDYHAALDLPKLSLTKEPEPLVGKAQSSMNDYFEARDRADRNVLIAFVVLQIIWWYILGRG